jgi:hypothetical protein
MGPIPEGVPVAIISPGRRVIILETKVRSLGTLNIRLDVREFCLISPLRDVEI